MSTKSHLPHRSTYSAAAGAEVSTRDEARLVFTVQRTGAIAVGAFLTVFGLVGLIGGLGFLDTEGERVLGLSSNGLLSALSVLVGLVLLGAALRGPRVASTVMIVLGGLFLLSALGNLAVLRTDLNLLAFEVRNVLFSIAVGLLLLTLGAYGRVSGNLPADSPYAHPHPDDDEPDSFPSTAEEFAAETAMREAEVAVCNHVATEEQARRVRAMAAVHTRADRRRIWMGFDARQPVPSAPSAAPARHPAVARAVSRARDHVPGLGGRQ
jgi:hypothetical protein